MKKRFLAHLACGAALSVLIVSQVSCGSYNARPTTWGPRTESEFRSFVTPECQSVKDCLQDILGAPPYELSKDAFDAIRQWVVDNIHYISDEERWGVDDYWQTSEETLSLSTGDCEDIAILLCSLLRAYGIDAEQVYVTLGIDDEKYTHVFLMEDWYLGGEWRAIEPQANAQPLPPGCCSEDSDSADFGLLAKYKIAVAFNDLYYHDESFPWDGDQGSF